jgi:uncharacterized protein (DUF885 family)
VSTSTSLTPIFQLSHDIVDRMIEHDPMTGTYLGIHDRDALWPDMSPAGALRDRALFDAWRSEAQALRPTSDADRLAQFVLVDELGRWIDTIDRGNRFWNLNSIASPFQSMKNIFELMPKQTEQDFENIIARLMTIHEPLHGHMDTLAEGWDSTPVAGRQITEVIRQARVAAADGSSLDALVGQFDASACDDGAQHNRLEAAIGAAKMAFGEFATWLEEQYLPHAAADDAVGRDRYLAAAATYLGSTLDPEEAYRWGWQQLAELTEMLHRSCAEVDPTKTAAEVVDLLQNSADRAVHGGDAFLATMRQRQESALASLSGVHFEVPEQIRAIDVKAAPEGGSLAPYYTGPSEDFSRKGCVWYPLGGRTQFPIYQEITTAYHEGFPGHHLQVGVQTALAAELSRFHRLLVWYPGSGEGWALYAERFMFEQGFLERPDYVVGWLGGQLLRAARVVIDIGVHLGLAIPDDVDFHPGERWSFDLAREMLIDRALQDVDFAESEVIRYFGWPGQAIAYKLGERAILDLRTRLVAHGTMPLSEFHQRVLEVGSVGLDLLNRQVLAA